MVLGYKNQTITASSLEGKTHRMETATSGHPVLSIIDYQKEKGFPDHFMTYHAEGWIEPESDCTQKDKEGVVTRQVNTHLKNITTNIEDVYISTTRKRWKIMEVFTWTMMLTTMAATTLKDTWEASPAISLEQDTTC